MLMRRQDYDDGETLSLLDRIMIMEIKFLIM